MATYALDLSKPDAEILAEFSVPGTLTMSVITDGAGNRALDMSRNGLTGIDLIRWLTAGSAQDMQILARMKVAEGNNTFWGTTYYAGLILRADSASGVDGYSSVYGSNPNIHRTIRHVDQVGTTGATGLASQSDETVPWNQYHWRRMECVGNTIQTRWWTGTLDDEPLTWNLSVTDSTNLAGELGFVFVQRDANHGIVQVTDLYAATDGDVAGPVGSGGSVDVTGLAGLLSLLGQTGTLSLGYADAGLAGDLPILGQSGGTFVTTMDITGAAGAFTLTGTAGTLAIGQAPQGQAASLALTGETGSTATGQNLTGSAGALPVTGHEGSVAVGESADITGAAGSLSLTGHPGSVSVGAAPQGGAGNLNFTGQTGGSTTRGQAVTGNSGVLSLIGRKGQFGDEVSIPENTVTLETLTLRQKALENTHFKPH